MAAVLAADCDFAHFLLRTNPDVNLAGKRRMPNMPTLMTLNVAFNNDNAASSWLVPRLLRLSEYAGCRDKLTEDQMRTAAGIIASRWSMLDLGEIDDFLHRFMAGQYGHFYGAVDPMVITEALENYSRNVREPEMHREESERRQQERERNAADAVTWEQFCEMKGINEENPLDL